MSLLALSIPLAGFAVCGGNGTWTGTAGDTLWSNIVNWGGVCVPNGLADGATFPTVGAAQTVTVDIPVTLGLNPGTLIFSSPTTVYTIIGGNTLTLNAANTTMSVAGTTNFGNGAAALSNLIHLTNTNLSITGAGTLHFLDAGLTDAGGSTSNVNISGPSITNTNILPVAGATPGSQVIPNGNLTMTGGTLTNTNSGNVTGMTHYGSFFGANGNVTFTGVTINNTNSGGVAGALSHGSVIGMFAPTSTGTLTLTNSTANLVNNASNITPGVGSVFQSGLTNGPVIFNNSTVILTNNGNLTTAAATGDFIGGTGIIAGNLTGPLTLNGGTIQMVNNGNISGNNVPFGVFGNVLFVNTLTINGGGSIYLLNNGTVTQPPAGLFNTGNGVLAQTSITINNGLLAGDPDSNVETAVMNIQPAGTVSSSGFFFGSAAAPLQAAMTMNNSGTVLPGFPGLGNPVTPGTTPGRAMTLVGTYNQTATGILVIDILNSGSFSQLNVTDTTPATATGFANLGGALEVAVTPGFTLNPSDTFKIVTAAQNVTGTFTLPIINFNLPLGFTPVVTYFPTFALLSFTTSFTTTMPQYPGNFPGIVISSVNQMNQLNQMDRLRRFACDPPMAADPISFEPSMSEDPPSCEGPPPSPKKLKRLHAASERYKKNEPVPVVLKPISEEMPETPVPVCTPICYEPCLLNCEPYPWSFYFGPLGVAEGEFHTKGNQIGFNYGSAGGIVGFDYSSTNYGIGFSTMYQKVLAHVHKDWGRFNIDEIHASLYGKYSMDCVPELSFNGILGAGYDIYHIKRKIALPFTHLTARGNPQGNEFDALLGAMYTLGENRWQVIPQLSLQYIRAHVDGYRERNGGFYDLQFESQNINSLRSTLGLRANYTWTHDTVDITPEINIDWQREYLYHERTLTFASVVFDEPPGSLEMPASGRNIVLAGVNLFVNICDKYGIEMNYSFEWEKLSHDHLLYIDGSFRF